MFYLTGASCRLSAKNSFTYLYKKLELNETHTKSWRQRHLGQHWKPAQPGVLLLRLASRHEQQLAPVLGYCKCSLEQLTDQGAWPVTRSCRMLKSPSASYCSLTLEGHSFRSCGRLPADLSGGLEAADVADDTAGRHCPAVSDEAALLGSACADCADSLGKRPL